MTDELKCQECGDPTINEPYLGLILCDDCTYQLDEFIDQKIDEIQLREALYEPEL